MKVSTKGRYAIRAMLDLALQATECPTVIKDISRRQGISSLYLEQLFALLKAGGLAESLQGPKGGFILTKPPSQISLLEILQTMEGSTASVSCVDNPILCPRADSCAARKLWIKVKRAIDSVLESTTLEDLARSEARSQVETGQ